MSESLFLLNYHYEPLETTTGQTSDKWALEIELEKDIETELSRTTGANQKRANYK